MEYITAAVGEHGDNIYSGYLVGNSPSARMGVCLRSTAHEILQYEPRFVSWDMTQSPSVSQQINNISDDLWETSLE